MNFTANLSIKCYESLIDEEVHNCICRISSHGVLLGHKVGNLKVFVGTDKMNG